MLLGKGKSDNFGCGLALMQGEKVHGGSNTNGVTEHDFGNVFATGHNDCAVAPGIRLKPEAISNVTAYHSKPPEAVRLARRYVACKSGFSLIDARTFEEIPDLGARSYDGISFPFVLFSALRVNPC